MKIFQFYEGKMSEQTSYAINDLKTKAERGGHTHELYDLKRLLNEITDDNLKEAIKRMWKYLPHTMAASATSDFFRYYILQNGGIYCDDDVYCTTDIFPELPTQDGVFTCSEQTNRHLLNTCVTVANGQKGMFYGRIMTQIASDRLKQCWLDSYEQCKANAKYLIDHTWSLINFIGPALVRHFLTFFIKNGVIIEKMPFELCSSHDPSSKLFHLGSGTWCYGGSGNPNAQSVSFIKA